MKILGIIIFVFGLVSSCWSDPVKIGLSLGLSGRYAKMSSMQQKAYRLWEDTLNNQGGINGQKVVLFIYDDKSDPDRTRSLYKKMIAQDRVDLLFAPYSSSLTAAILPITEASGFPILTSGASADSLWKKGYRCVYGVYTPASRYTIGFLEMLLMNGFSKISMVASDDDFSQSLAKGTEKWIRRLGMELVITEKIKKGETDLSKIANRFKASDTDAVIMCGHYNESVVMRLAFAELKWHPKAYYASVGPVLKNYHDTLGPMSQGTFSSTNWQYINKLPFPGAGDFYHRFRERYGIEPSYHAATAYAACVILETAIKKAGGPDRKQICDILSTLDTTTLLGRYGVDRTGMQIMHFMLTIQWINGKKEVVWPRKLSTSPPVFSGE